MPIQLTSAGQTIKAEIPTVDDCPVLTRLKAFLVPQGVLATLEHTFRDRYGNPVDLSDIIPASGVSESVSASSSSSSSPSPTGSAVLRVKEWLAAGRSYTNNPIWEIPAVSPDPAAGVLSAKLEEDVVAKGGIYRLSWGVKNAAGEVLATEEGIMSVEHTLYTFDDQTLRRDLGPPTIGEIRMSLMDSSPTENFYLNDIEFKDEQILMAIAWPVEYWNEVPPPIETFTTRNFPFRGHWKAAIAGNLFQIAATHYRRTRLPHAAGGVTVDDKNKEREYLAEATRRLQEYKDWVFLKKVEINTAKFYGSTGSIYGRR